MAGTPLIDRRRGLVATLGAFLIWGFSPLFWRLLSEVPATQLLAHRIAWAAVLLLALSFSLGRLGEVRKNLRSSKTVLTLAVTTILIAANWLTYIWAVLTERVLQASLGYYINPLVTVLLAMIFLGERLERAQWLSVVLAACGVLILVWHHGTLPWIALVLAFSFGFYALLRKQVGAEAEAGLLIETGFLTPFATAFLIHTSSQGSGAFGRLGLEIDGLLVASGVITALPLYLFTYGARRLPLATTGFLQFSAPTVQFLLAVFLFGEPFGGAHLVAFLSIWIGLAVFSWDLSRRWSHSRAEPAVT